MIKDNEIVIEVGRAVGGDFVRIVHVPTGISREKGPPLGSGRDVHEFRRQALQEIEAELTEKGLTQYLLPSVILQTIWDVYQIEGLGTVVTGATGAGWNRVQRGDRIELRTPDGRRIRTAVKDLEIFTKGRLETEPVPSAGVLLADVVASDQLPRGTKMLRITEDWIE